MALNEKQLNVRISKCDECNSMMPIIECSTLHNRKWPYAGHKKGCKGTQLEEPHPITAMGSVPLGPLAATVTAGEKRKFLSDEGSSTYGWHYHTAAATAQKERGHKKIQLHNACSRSA